MLSRSTEADECDAPIPKALPTAFNNPSIVRRFVTPALEAKNI
jgi:hypothetical protein